MNRRVVVSAIAGALVALVATVRAEDSSASHVERAAPSPARSEDNDPAQTNPQTKPQPDAQPDPKVTSWTFDRSLYTNDAKTGSRVWQYAKKKPAYRDPYSFLDSPHEAFPFSPDPFYGPYYSPYLYYGEYPYSRPYPYGPMPYTPSQ